MNLADARALFRARRSIRRFRPEKPEVDLLSQVVETALWAPAPHHLRPWRFALLLEEAAKRRLATAMARRWVADMLGDGIPEAEAQRTAEASIQRLSNAPALLLGCLVSEGMTSYSDDRRRRAEWGMGLLSLGAALQNVMLAAAAVGLGTCWIAAPIFAPAEAREALGLPEDWTPQALLMLGRPDPTYTPPRRPDPELERFVKVFA